MHDNPADCVFRRCQVSQNGLETVRLIPRVSLSPGISERAGDHGAAGEADEGRLQALLQRRSAGRRRQAR